VYVERFHMQEERAIAVVAAQPLRRARKHFCRKEIFLALEILDVGVIAAAVAGPPVIDRLREGRQRLIGRRRIPVLKAAAALRK
jgi:hypothetical protein